MRIHNGFTVARIQQHQVCSQNGRFSFLWWLIRSLGLRLWFGRGRILSIGRTVDTVEGRAAQKVSNTKLNQMCS